MKCGTHTKQLFEDKQIENCTQHIYDDISGTQFGIRNAIGTRKAISIHVSKAFDNVKRDKVLEVFEIGIDGKDIRIITILLEPNRRKKSAIKKTTGLHLVTSLLQYMFRRSLCRDFG